MERLGIGPDECLARNPKLVFGRMTGWGQDGPYAQAAGHDINYIALAGALAHFGRGGRGAGAAAQHGRRLRRRRHVPRLRRGVRAARGAAQRAGPGGRHRDGRRRGDADEHVLGDAARSACSTRTRRGTNLLDTGAHFYDVFECADGKYVSIGSIEPQFYAELMRLTGLSGDPEFAQQMDKAQWPHLKERLQRGDAQQDPRRVVRADGAHRRLLRPGAHHERGRCSTRTTSPAARSSKSPARPSRRPPRGSRARRPRSTRRRRTPASTRAQMLADWGFDGDRDRVARRQAAL